MSLGLGTLMHLPIAAGIVAGAVLTGLLAGAWPAFVLSSFRPNTVLRGGSQGGGYGIGMRRVLVVVQFGISIALIIGSGVVFQQMQYIKNKDLGYDREQVLTIQMTQETAANFEPLVEKLGQSPAILSLSVSGNVPGRTMSRTGVQPDGIAETDPWVVSVMSMDELFLETLGIELVAGRNFSQEFGTDAEQAVILNEAAVKAIGWEEPLGKTFNDGQLTVVGVIGDFHFATLRHVVEPLMISFRPGDNGILSLKLRAGAIPAGIDHLHGVWGELFPGNPLEFGFLDDEFDQTYRREQNFGSLTRGFTFLAIFIACLGLFGLASHTVELLLSKMYLKLVLLANLIAWPAAYFLMRRWLQDFVYRIDLGVGVFLLSMAAAAVIALLTVSFHSIRAAGADPVRALRYE
jgi:putative ABC transport system permease protein